MLMGVIERGKRLVGAVAAFVALPAVLGPEFVTVMRGVSR